ncbi:MAG: alpha-amylase, partial [Dehalococcoidia bacterium]
FYLGDRNGVRTPMQWSADRNAGFSAANPQRLYLPVNIEPEYHYETINVETQQNNPDSFLWWMKRLIALRGRYKAFGRGSVEFLHPENRKILAFIRRHEDQTLLVVANLSRHAQHTYLNLAGLAGRVPIELFGRTVFPTVTDSPFPLSLGPYAFYWFALESEESRTRDSGPARETITPTLSVRKGLEDLTKRPYRTRFEAALLQYARRSRWFGGKARRTRTATIQEAIPVVHDDVSAFLIVLRVEYTDGEPESYLIPVGVACGESATHLLTERPDLLIANLERKAGATDTPEIIFDALASPEFRDALLKSIERRRRHKGQRGTMTSYRTKNVFTQTRGPLQEKLESRLLKVEQSNTSAVFGDRFILKLYRRLEEGTSPELEIGRFLTEQEPYANTPAVAGAIEYRTEPRSEPITLAILHTYTRNEGNAWKYTLDVLGRFFEQALTLSHECACLPVSKSLLKISQEEVPPQADEVIGPYLESARLLGQRTAELHLALASAESANFAPGPFSAIYQRSLYHGHRGYTIQVLNALKSALPNLSDEMRGKAEIVLSQRDVILSRLQAVTRRRINAMRIRCHGDYHLGQLLHTGGDFVIIDFEGEPAMSLGERRIKRSPLKDVAGMIRSFHYATHVALHEQTTSVLRRTDIPALEDWARSWYMWVSGAFLRSYMEIMADTPVLPSRPEDTAVLLDCYLLQKALYEVNYEMNSRPEWLSVPIEGIMDILKAEP